MNKALILANDFSTLYNFRRELIIRLQQENYEVVLALPPSEKNTYFEEQGIRVLETPLERRGTNPIKDLVLFFKYKNIIKEEKPDVCLTYTAKPNVYGSMACSRYNIPYINNVTGLGSCFYKEDIIKKILILLQRIAFKKSHCVFFQNNANLNFFIDKGIVSEEVAALLPGSGVNLNIHKFEEYPKEGPVKFITVARIRNDKGYKELFEAAIEIKKLYPEVQFNIVGGIEDRELEENLKTLSEKNVIIYHGEKTQEEVHELICESHCLIHPSYHEGMANVILEAEATGRPCLVSDISGCREAIDDSVTGYLFAPQNADSLKESIIKFISQDYEIQKNMGIAAREKVSGEFDRELVVDTYIETINMLLNKEAYIGEFI